VRADAFAELGLIKERLTRVDDLEVNVDKIECEPKSSSSLSERKKARGNARVLTRCDRPLLRAPERPDPILATGTAD
jgi:hypothetical protein